MFYIWVGQKQTTFGTPNVITGRHSLHGDLIAFNTRKERDLYYNNCYSRAMYTTLERTNKHDAKSDYFAGMSQTQYTDYLKMVDAGYICLEGWGLVTDHLN